MTHYMIYDTLAGRHLNVERFLCTYDALDYIKENYSQGQWDLFEIHEFQHLSNEKTLVTVHSVEITAKSEYYPGIS